MLAPNRILVPLDFSGASDAALRRAADLAARTGAALHVLHVVAGFEMTGAEMPDADRAFYQRVWDRAEAKLNNYLQRAGLSGTGLEYVLAHGAPSQAILAYAEAHDIGLIVMGTHGRTGLQRFFLGSVAHEVLRRAEMPVMVVPMADAPLKPLRRVVAPTDFSDASRMVLPVAASLAALYGADLDLLHVLEPVRYLEAIAGTTITADLTPGLRERAERKVQEFVADPDLARMLAGRDQAEDLKPVEGGAGLARIRSHVAEGRAAETIAEAAREWHADAIVMAKRGLHGVERFLLGSVTSRVCHLAPCAVLVVPFGFSA